MIFVNFVEALLGPPQKIWRPREVNNKWRARLTEVLDENNGVHNTIPRAREGGMGIGAEEKPKPPQNGFDKIDKNNPEASERGLVATWAATFGFVSIHDPLDGTWHDIQTGEAPTWALAESGLRKRLYKSGDRRAYSHNARKMQGIWDSEHPPPDRGIREEYGIEAEDQREDYSA